MTPLDATRTRIKSAALELFANLGLDGVTVRALTERANANMASINYHFGSKDKLTIEIFREVARKSAHLRNAMLDDLEIKCLREGRCLMVREIIETFVSPYLDSGDQRSGVLLAQLIMKHRAAPNEWTKAVVRDELDDMALRYMELLRDAVPHLSHAAVHWRYHLMVGGLVMALGDKTSTNRIRGLSGEAISAWDVISTRKEVVDFLVAGFGAQRS